MHSTPSLSGLRGRVLAALLAACVVSCGEQPAPEVEATTYNIDTSRISVSGLSSGAHMATQLHLAHSRLFRGAAILSGGPYYCAEGSLNRGIGPCLKGGDIPVNRFVAYARDMEAAGKIDALANLADDKVWIFHGALDDVVDVALTRATSDFYGQLMPPDSVTSVEDIQAVHGLPTVETGWDCDSFTTPFLTACAYDAAGNWLSAIYGELDDPVDAVGELRTIPQTGAAGAEMLDEAYLYVPNACAEGESCGIHVAVHGCSQSSEYVADAFASGSGINEWAESNRLLVLYPQVASSRMAPMNPYGCWDWWGYTNEDYANQSGPQLAVIKEMLDRLSGTAL